MYVGIDASFVKTGLVILSDEGVMVDHRILSSDRSIDIVQQCRQMSGLIYESIMDIEVYSIGIEQLSYSSKGNQTRDLAGLWFIIVNSLRYDLGYNVNSCNITSVKKFGCGSGRGSKRDLYNACPEYVKEKFATYTLKDGREDLSDAYWVAQFNRHNATISKTRYGSIPESMSL